MGLSLELFLLLAPCDRGGRRGGGQETWLLLAELLASPSSPQQPRLTPSPSRGCAREVTATVLLGVAHHLLCGKDMNLKAKDAAVCLHIHDGKFASQTA